MINQCHFTCNSLQFQDKINTSMAIQLILISIPTAKVNNLFRFSFPIPIPTHSAYWLVNVAWIPNDIFSPANGHWHLPLIHTFPNVSICHDPTQTWQDIVRFKACLDLFLRRLYTSKRVLPIKVWITPYIPSISPVLCRCGIRLECYIHPPLETQRPRWGLPHHRSRGHAEPLWYHNVMTQPKPGNILSALGLNKARTDLFLGRLYTPKRVLPIKLWITPYIPSISPVLCRCGIRLGCYSISLSC